MARKIQEVLLYHGFTYSSNLKQSHLEMLGYRIMRACVHSVILRATCLFFQREPTLSTPWKQTYFKGYTSVKLDKMIRLNYLII